MEDRQERIGQEDKKSLQNSLLIHKVNSRALSYTERHRGNWFRPEFDFDEIQIAQSTDGYLARAIQKKVNRVITSGWGWTGKSTETVEYIKMRIARIEWSSQSPFVQLIVASFQDMFRYSNCIWVKVRDNKRSAGSIRRDFYGTMIDPVAGYFILPMETLEFQTKANGEIKQVLQKLPSGRKKQFNRKDIIHFYANKNPGFATGTPEMLPALDDIALLRRIEENVEDLIETSLFPVFHYKVGNDKFPERRGTDGYKETDVVKANIEYMPAGGVYVSDHRHEISAIGSEGSALRIDYYIQHFKNRVFASLGVSGIDLGEGGDANRSTASTLSKGMLMDVEAMTILFKNFVEFFVVTELLLEGGYNPFDAEQMVHMKFGVIDKDSRRADENQVIQLFQANLKTYSEARAALGDPPVDEADFDDLHHKLFAEPTNLIRGLGPGTAASETLAEHKASNISPAAVKKEKAAQEKAEKQRNNTATGRPGKTSGDKTKAVSGNKAKPANQHGSRQSAKTTRDVLVKTRDGSEYHLTCDDSLSDDKLQSWISIVKDRYSLVADSGIKLRTVADSLKWRLEAPTNG